MPARVAASASTDAAGAYSWSSLPTDTTPATSAYRPDGADAMIEIGSLAS